MIKPLKWRLVRAVLLLLLDLHGPSILVVFQEARYNISKQL
jgi:hypothetical protein